MAREWQVVGRTNASGCEFGGDGGWCAWLSPVLESSLSATFPSGIEFSGLSRCLHCPEMVYRARFSAGSGRAVGIVGI